MKKRINKLMINKETLRHLSNYVLKQRIKGGDGNTLQGSYISYDYCPEQQNSTVPGYC